MHSGSGGKEREDAHASIRKATKQNLLAKQVRNGELRSLPDNDSPTIPTPFPKQFPTTNSFPNSAASTRTPNIVVESPRNEDLSEGRWRNGSLGGVSGSSFGSSLYFPSSASAFSDDALLYWVFFFSICGVCCLYLGMWCVCVFLVILYSFCGVCLCVCISSSGFATLHVVL